MKKLFKFILSALGIILVAVLVVPLLIPGDVYKEQLLSLFKEKMGRELTIEGDISFHVLPNIAFSAEKVKLSNPEGYSHETMMEIATLDIGVELMPLFDNEIRMTELTLLSPVIRLERGPRGVNWEFSPALKPETSVRNSSEHAQEGVDTKPAMAATHFGDITIKDGSLWYRDVLSGTEVQAEKLDVLLSYSKNAPLDIEGETLWNGKKVRVALSVDHIADLMNGIPQSAGLSVASDALTLDFEGVLEGVSLAGFSDAKASGALRADVASLNQLGIWLGGEPLLPANKPGRVQLTGNGDFAMRSMELDEVVVSLDDMKARGEMMVAYGKSTKPHLIADLAFEALNLNPYLGKGMQQTASTSQSSASGGSGKMGGWNSEPMNFSGLHAIDADIKSRVEGLVVQSMELGAFDARLKLSGGKLDISIPTVALYGGEGAVEATIDASKTPVALKKQFSLEKVNGEAFLRDIVDEDRIAGTLTADMFFTGRGNSQAAMVQSLHGGGKILFEDGAIKGIDIARMMRNIKSAFAETDTSVRETDFALLTGSFAIDRGVMRNSDLLMQAPLLRLQGSGNIHLPKQWIDYRLVPTLVKTLKGQGDEKTREGLMVPVMVRGPLSKPKFSPDLKGLIQEGLKDPEKIKNTAGAVKDGLKNLQQNENYKDLNSPSDVVDKIKKDGLPKDLNSPSDFLRTLGGGGIAPAQPPTPEPALAPALPVEPASEPAVDPTPEPTPAVEPVPEPAAPAQQPAPESPATP